MTPKQLRNFQCDAIVKQSAYRWRRMQWRKDHPPHPGNTDARTPELEKMQADRIDDQWKAKRHG